MIDGDAPAEQTGAEPSRITITGAAGFLGSHLARQLRRAFPGARITGVDPSPPSEPVSGIDYTRALPARSDILFHLAGGSGVGPSLADPRRDLQINVGSVLDVLDAVQAGAVDRVVLASTAAIYGAVEGAVHEDHPPAPISPYGVSKLSAEHYLLAAWRLRGADVRIARIANAYGPGQRHHVIWDLGRRALSSPPPLSIHGDGGELRDFVHAADIARGLLAIALRGEPGGVYNLGSGQTVRIAEIARQLSELATPGAGAVQPDSEQSAAKVRCFAPDISRLRALGFAPAIELSDGLSETLDWIRRQR